MPGTEKQRKAASAELGRRRSGAKKSKGRPFGTATQEDLRDFARGKGKRKTKTFKEGGRLKKAADRISGRKPVKKPAGKRKR